MKPKLTTAAHRARLRRDGVGCSHLQSSMFYLQLWRCLIRAALCLATLLSFATPALGVERQTLPGHVPQAIVRLGLQPIGRLPATNQLRLAIGLPLRNTNALDRLLQD